MVPNGKPIAVARSHAGHERLQSEADIKIEPRTFSIVSPEPALVGGDVERLADGEQPHREHDHVDAVEQLGHAEGEARLPGLAVDADQAEQQAEEEARQPAHRRAAEHRRDGDEREHHEREVLGRPELEREIDHDRREQREQDRGDGAGDERADRAVASAGPARPALAMRLPSSAVAIDADSPGVLRRMVVVEPPNIAP